MVQQQTNEHILTVLELLQKQLPQTNMETQKVAKKVRRETEAGHSRDTAPATPTAKKRPRSTSLDVSYEEPDME